MDKKYKRLGINTILVLIGNIGSKLVMFLLVPFYTRWLSVDDFGTADTVMTYAILLLGIAALSIGEAIFVFPKDKSFNVQQEYFSSGIAFLVFSTIVSSVALFGIEFIVERYGLHGIFVDNIPLIVGILIAMLLQHFVQQFTRSINKMAVYSTTGIVLSLANVLFSFLLIRKYFVVGYAITFMLSYFVAAIYSFFMSKSYKFFSFKAICKERCIEMLKFCVPLIPKSVMWWLASSLNRPLMESYLGIAAIGMYAVVNKIPNIINIIYVSFTKSWVISVIEEFKSEKFNEFYNKVLKTSVLFLFVMLIVICMSSPLVMKIMASPSYYAAWTYIPFLTLAAVFVNISSFIGSVFSASKESKYIFYSSCITTIAAIVFNYVFISWLGFIGACIALIFTMASDTVSIIFFSRKYVKYDNILTYVVLLIIVVVYLLIVYKYQSEIIALLIGCMLLIFISYYYRMFIATLLATMKKNIKRK